MPATSLLKPKRRLKTHRLLERRRNWHGDLKQRRDGKLKATWDTCSLAEFFRTFMIGRHASFAKKISLLRLKMSEN